MYLIDAAVLRGDAPLCFQVANDLELIGLAYDYVQWFRSVNGWIYPCCFTFMCLSDFILHLPPSEPFIYFPSIDENVITHDPFIVVFFFFF